MEEKTTISNVSENLSPEWTDDRMVSLVHRALDSYSIMVWNGEDHPIEKPIGQAITTISEVVKENTTLLSGIRARRKVFEPLSQFFVQLEGATKKSRIIKIIMIIVGGATSVMGIISLLKTIF